VCESCGIDSVCRSVSLIFPLHIHAIVSQKDLIEIRQIIIIGCQQDDHRVTVNGRSVPGCSSCMFGGLYLDDAVIIVINAGAGTFTCVC
jgi:hypothetical protein